MNTIQTLRKAIQPSVIKKEEVKEVIVLTAKGHRGIYLHTNSFDTLTLPIAKNSNNWLPFLNQTIALPDYLIFCEPKEKTANQLFVLVVNLPNKPKNKIAWTAKTTVAIKLTKHLLDLFQYQHDYLTIPTPIFRSLVFFNATDVQYPILKKKRLTKATNFTYQTQESTNYTYTQKLWPKNIAVGYDLNMFVK